MRHQPALDTEGGADSLALEPLGAAAEDLLEVARILLDLPRQLHLVAEVVVDDPLIPEERRGVHVVVPFAGENRMGIGRRGVEGNPPVAGEVDFHPAMRVAGAHHKVLADAVVRPRLKSIHQPRGHIQRTQHHGHGGGEILAVAGLGAKEEAPDRIRRLDFGRVQRILEIAAQVGLDSGGAIVVIGGGSGKGTCQFADARVQGVRQAEIHQPDLVRILGGGFAQVPARKEDRCRKSRRTRTAR